MEPTAESRTDAPPAPTGSVAELGEISIAYEEFGDPGDPTLLLIMGLGMQLLAWDEDFCRLLVAEGFHVIRYDNRDVGLSTKFDGERVNLKAGLIGLTGSAAYSLDEMATDAIGLLDHLGEERTHLVGASMGGMIAQKLAAKCPRRVLSLCSIMSGSGKRSLSTVPRPDVLRMLLQPPAKDRESFLEGIGGVFEKIGSPAYPTDPERLRKRAAISYDRSFYPAGTARQMMAVMAAGDRTAELAGIEAPTLVIHGGADRLVPAAAGRAVAKAIDGARYEEFEGMGHDLPPQLWPRIVELIGQNASQAAGAAND